MDMHTYTYPAYAKLIHLGIAVFGITAFLTGEFAEDGNESLGYLFHAYLGLSLAGFMAVRIIGGLTSSEALSFKSWSPFTKENLSLALEDLRSLLTLNVPDRGRHQGIAGLTQAFGLLIFGWMAITGTGLFLLASETESSVFEIVEETHEVGESLIPVYLALHVGAVILHSLSGNPVWKKMFSRK